MGEEGKKVDDLTKLLDETLSDFEKRKVTDDELDDIMQEYDKSAVQKSAKEFDAMLNKLSEELQNKPSLSGKSDDELLSELNNPEIMNLFSSMKETFMSQDMSPMIKATAEKYNTYLTEKSDKLSSEDKIMYEKQRDQLLLIADEYAKPEPDPSEMDARLEQIKSLWGELQKLGEPPADLFPVESMSSDCTIC